MENNNFNDFLEGAVNLNTLDELSKNDLKELCKIFKITINDVKKNNEGEIAPISVDDNTDIEVNSKARKEQTKLRKYLFKDLNISSCALCHRNLPVELLVAAHIKPRQYCSEHERKDYKIVMPLCRLCDDFYEKHYLQVNDDGSFHRNKYKNFSKGAIQLYNEYYKDQKKCSHHNEDTKKYFEYKRTIFLKRSQLLEWIKER